MMREILEDLNASGGEDIAKKLKRANERKLPKRFYEKVTIDNYADEFFPLLDGCKINTPARRQIALPNRNLAELVAKEFRDQNAVIDPSTMPVTRIVNTVIDGVVDDTQSVFEDILRFARSDMLFYRATSPEALINRQQQLWDPIIDWIEMRLAANFNIGSGIIPIEQPKTAMIAFSSQLRQFSSPFALAALHTMTALTGSAIIAFSVAKHKLNLEEAWRLAHLDEDWTAEIWGVDFEAQAQRDFRQKEFKAAVAILQTITN